MTYELTNATQLAAVQAALGVEPHPWAGKKVAHLGTSITAFGAYTSALAKLIPWSSMTNLGVSSATLSNGTNGNGNIYAQRTSIPAGTDLITIEAPRNDYAANVPLGAWGDTTTSTTYGAIYRIIADIMTSFPSATIVWLMDYVDPTLAYLTANSAPGTPGTYKAYMQAVEDTCAMFGVPIINMGRADMVGFGTGSLYLKDNIHPNRAGGLKLARYIYDQLRLIKPREYIPNIGTPAPGTWTWSLAAATLADLSGSGLTVNSLTGGAGGGVGVTQTGGFTYSALWLASGAHNACEFTLAANATNPFILVGLGASGWLALGDLSNFALVNWNKFALANGSITQYGNVNTGLFIEPSVGTKYRVARVGALLYVYQYDASQSAWVEIMSGFDLSTASAAGYYETAQVGIGNIFGITVTSVQTGIFAP